MIDIVSVGQDIGLFDTQTNRAANILSVQLGYLEYAPELGIDLKYFLSEDFQFQNESFKAYLVQVLASFGINVIEVNEQIENLYAKFVFNIPASQSGNGLIAR